MIRKRLGELEDKFGSQPVIVITEKVSRYENQYTGGSVYL
jgi:hypothetical protein